MFGLVLLILLAIVLAGVGAFIGSDSGDGFVGFIIGGGIGAVILAIGFAFITIETVEEGHVAVKVTFGVADDEPLEPGWHFVMPWSNLVEMSTREQVISFEGDDPEDEALGLDDITMQTEGGGGFDLDARLRVALPREQAVEIWRTLGTNYQGAVIIPSGRECIRDASVEMDLTAAITTGRSQIASNSEACLEAKLTDAYGIRVIGVELGGTDVPQAVQTAINDKQAAEQGRQAAEFELERKRIEAEGVVVDAKAISDAEQIVACGATEQVTVDDQGNEVVTIIPNEECEDQFSEEYLEWLFLQQLGQVDQLIVVDPRVADGANVLLNTGGQ